MRFLLFLILTLLSNRIKVTSECDCALGICLLCTCPTLSNYLALPILNVPCKTSNDCQCYCFSGQCVSASQGTNGCNSFGTNGTACLQASDCFPASYKTSSFTCNYIAITTTTSYMSSGILKSNLSTTSIVNNITATTKVASSYSFLDTTYASETNVPSIFNSNSSNYNNDTNTIEIITDMANATYDKTSERESSTSLNFKTIYPTKQSQNLTGHFLNYTFTPISFNSSQYSVNTTLNGFLANTTTRFWSIISSSNSNASYTNFAIKNTSTRSTSTTFLECNSDLLTQLGRANIAAMQQLQLEAIEANRKKQIQLLNNKYASIKMARTSLGFVAIAFLSFLFGSILLNDAVKLLKHIIATCSIYKDNKNTAQENQNDNDEDFLERNKSRQLALSLDKYYLTLLKVIYKNRQKEIKCDEETV